MRLWRVVAGYLEHRDLAEAEDEAERFFMNVVLCRVLYAHALVAAAPGPTSGANSDSAGSSTTG